jgi:hypothetical protein
LGFSAHIRGVVGITHLHHPDHHAAFPLIFPDLPPP